MHKVLTIILFLISGAFSVKAVDVDASDSLDIYYDGIYAVDLYILLLMYSNFRKIV